MSRTTRAMIEVRPHTSQLRFPWLVIDERGPMRGQDVHVRNQRV